MKARLLLNPSCILTVPPASISDRYLCALPVGAPTYAPIVKPILPYDVSCDVTLNAENIAVVTTTAINLVLFFMIVCFSYIYYQINYSAINLKFSQLEPPGVNSLKPVRISMITIPGTIIYFDVLSYY